MRSSKVTLLVCALFFILLPSGLRAETAGCETYPDDGERLKCKHGKILDEQGKLIEKLETNFGQFIPPDSIERMKRAHGRATKAKDRSHAKHFKSLGKKSPDPEACKIKALAGYDLDGDGECDPGDRCEEIVGDYIGDDRQPCKMKGKNPEACVEVCAGDDTMEDDVDPESLADVEEGYDDVTQSLVAANAVLEQNGQMIASMMGSLAAGGPAADCQASTDWLGFHAYLWTTLAKGISAAYGGIHGVAVLVCGVDFGGFNLNVACIPSQAIATALDLVAVATEGVFGTIGVFLDDSTQKCLSSLSGDLQETKTTLQNTTATLGTVASTTTGSSNQLTEVVADVENIKTTVNGLTTSVNALSTTVDALRQRLAELFEAMNKRFTDVETLLNTPQGQRPSFPPKEQE